MAEWENEALEVHELCHRILITLPSYAFGPGKVSRPEPKDDCVGKDEIHGMVNSIETMVVRLLSDAPSRHRMIGTRLDLLRSCWADTKLRVLRWIDADVRRVGADDGELWKERKEHWRVLLEMCWVSRVSILIVMITEGW